MLKHAVAHRSSSSLGGCSTSSNSCLTSYSSGPSSFSSFDSTASLPTFRRSSLSSVEVKNRPVYRRTESYQPYSLATYRESSEIVAEAERKNVNDIKSGVPPVDDRTCSNGVHRIDGGYQPVYQKEFYKGNYVRSWERTTFKNSETIPESNIACTSFINPSPESPLGTQPTFAEKINRLDSYPSESNDYDVDDANNSSDMCELRISPKISSLSPKISRNTTVQNTATCDVDGNAFKLYSTFRPHPGQSPAEAPPARPSVNDKINSFKASNPRSMMPPLHPRSSSLSLGTSNRTKIHPDNLIPEMGSPHCRPYFLPKSPSVDIMSLASLPNTPLPPLPRSSTLPRRDVKEELRRASLRSNTSAVSLLSSASCSSLSFFKNLGSSRSGSTSSLSETIPVKLYLRRLRPDMEYKTVSLSSQTTCKELIASLLTKFRLRHRDPKLFFIIMEVTVQSPADNAPVKRTLVLDDNARPAELQQCRPRGEARFSVGVRRGGLVRVHDSILMPGSQYKSLMVSYNTDADELVQLMLKCYNSLEIAQNYAVHEVCKNPYKDRQLSSDECPLMVQNDWPRVNRTNWAFVLRRNLTYAFSLKSRMNWRRSLDQSSTDTESEIDDHNTTTNFLSTSVVASANDSRSSSVSSTSSVSSACSSSSSDNSLDSGYLGSPLSGCKVPSNQITTSPLPEKNVKLVRDSQPVSSKIRTILPVTAAVSRLSLNSKMPSVTASPVPVSATTSATSPGLPPRPVTKTIITITSTVRAPQSSASQTSNSGPVSNIQRSHLRPIIAPPTLRISPCNACIPHQTTICNKEPLNSSTYKTVSPFRTYHFSTKPLTSCNSQPPAPPSSPSPQCFNSNLKNTLAVSSPTASAEKKLLDAIESLKTLSEVGFESRLSNDQ